MKVNELRIGNIINLGDRVVIVDLAVINRIGNAHYKTTPIPLTEEWLIKFGFEFKKYKLTTLVSYTLKDLEFMFSDSELISVYIGLERIDNGSRINTVHLLQNLYYVRTGEELDINN